MAKKTTKKKKTAIRSKNATKKKRSRREKPFPNMPLTDASVIAEAIERHASGQPMKRLTLFDALKKSPESGPSRMLITASSKYGLTEGGYQADELSLTPLGKKLVSEESTVREKMRAKYDAGISSVDAFSMLHERFSGSKLPSQSVLRDYLIDEVDVPPNLVSECIDTFIVNAKDAGVLKEIAGAERLLPIDHIIDELPPQQSKIFQPVFDGSGHDDDTTESNIELPAPDEWGNVCFYVTPIGQEGSDQRKHSDLFLEHIVEPALAPLDLKVVRADKVGRPGMITKRVIEYVVRSRLVVADLSFHNPNVFYELSLRHACGLPTIQIISSEYKIPFDLKDFDTISIDDTSVYTLVPKLDVYRSQIATQARSVLQDDSVIDNPIKTYFPGLSVQFI